MNTKIGDIKKSITGIPCLVTRISRFDGESDRIEGMTASGDEISFYLKRTEKLKACRLSKEDRLFLETLSEKLKEEVKLREQLDEVQKEIRNLPFDRKKQLGILSSIEFGTELKKYLDFGNYKVEVSFCNERAIIQASFSKYEKWVADQFSFVEEQYDGEFQIELSSSIQECDYATCLGGFRKQFKSELRTIGSKKYKAKHSTELEAGDKKSLFFTDSFTMEFPCKQLTVETAKEIASLITIRDY